MQGLKKRKLPKDSIRDVRVYSYVPQDIGEWIDKKAKLHKVTFASFVYAALKNTYKNNRAFDPTEYLPKKK